MATKELMQEIIEQYDELLFWLDSECPEVAPPLEPYDTSDLSHDFCELLRVRLNEIFSLKSQLAEAGEEKKEEKLTCFTCKFDNVPYRESPCFDCMHGVSQWQPR